MREIKFRVCSIDNMFYIVNGGEYQLIFGIGGLDWSLWDEEGEICNSNEVGTVLMQYTGLKDKNGKEIYEGDIIRWHGLVTFDYPITFTDGVFCLNDSPSENFWHHREDIEERWEVIGNIHENPDLLTD